MRKRFPSSFKIFERSEKDALGIWWISGDTISSLNCGTNGLRASISLPNPLLYKIAPLLLRLIAQMAQNVKSLGIKDFDLEHDNYEVSPPKLEDVLQAFSFVGCWRTSLNNLTVLKCHMSAVGDIFEVDWTYPEALEWIEVHSSTSNHCSSTLLKVASRSRHLKHLSFPVHIMKPQYQLSSGALVALCGILSRSNTLREDFCFLWSGPVTSLPGHDFALVQKALASGHSCSNQSCWKHVEAGDDERRRARTRFELVCFYVAMNRFRGFFASHDQPVGLAPFVLAKCQHANGLHEATRSHYRAETDLLFSILRERVDWVTHARDSRP